MRLSYFQKTIHLTSPMSEPAWSEYVPRWYQLDGFALALTDLIFNSKPEFDSLILCGEFGSNQTDLEFVSTGATRAQKFVHTLPNVRASMALQSISRVCDFVCLQGPLKIGLEEFQAQIAEGKKPALVQVYQSEKEEPNHYKAWVLSLEKSKNYEEGLIAL